MRKTFVELEGSKNAKSSLDLAVVIPTFNERESLPELVWRLQNTLQGLHWELIVIDDDSPDGTAEVVRELSLKDHRIRLIHRIGRRGLSSACIEGMMATTSPCIAVMDADLQHDESLLPLMLRKLRNEDLDLIVATRNAEGGSMGSFSAPRLMMSRLGKHISHAISDCELSDPLSGFFMLRRDLFLEVAHYLSRKGFKILLDIVTSSERPLKIGETGYRFRNRRYGKSKLNARVGLEFLAMILNKRIDGILPSRFIDFINPVNAAVDQFGISVGSPSKHG